MPFCSDCRIYIDSMIIVGLFSPLSSSSLTNTEESEYILLVYPFYLLEQSGCGVCILEG